MRPVLIHVEELTMAEVVSFGTQLGPKMLKL